MQSTTSLEGKTAIVTGGSRGIGAACAIQFAKKGISALAITYVSNKELAEEVVKKCRGLGVAKVVAIHSDLLDPHVGPQLVDRVLKELGAKTIDILVNNAVLTKVPMFEPFEKITVENFRDMMQGDLFGPINIIAAVLPHLPPRGGRVINISSCASKQAVADPMMLYGAAKAGLDSFTRSLAAQYGIKTLATFNSISVGATETDALQKAIDIYRSVVDDPQEMMIQQCTAEKRVADPEDVAFVVGFLATEEARWINGAQIPANGGVRDLIALQG
ncbi:uncharacterized protein PV06_08689 [Exophiala oligosperma]|uniref:3-oxoacyl-[acyl-carrier-protein] reductase n=2 Tax=Chaetothyriales TaxID=34395 RepID=A0A0D2AF94_9EURO|nr:uncharacterized protein PV06_08689 [Exophiala oligosperma]KAJ9645030.1 hypothetical protein H2204_001492 [Knufia peltigerae]KIW38861.1 hypothetical protein PV06_08689 [Exophiala oligosperma]